MKKKIIWPGLVLTKELVRRAVTTWPQQQHTETIGFDVGLSVGDLEAISMAK